jgi:hypothetical protein
MLGSTIAGLISSALSRVKRIEIRREFPAMPLNPLSRGRMEVSGGRLVGAS